LIFDVAHFHCAIPCAKVQEIVPVAATLSVPTQPPMLNGFLNLRGSLVPVVSLRHLFGLPRTAIEMYTPFVIVRTQDGLLGLCVDHVVEVAHIESSHLSALPANHSLNDSAEAQFLQGAATSVILNVDRLLLTEETKRLAELTARERRRLDEIEASRE
jgi:purine-binding chemotaxis protein CheW